MRRSERERASRLSVHSPSTSPQEIDTGVLSSPFLHHHIVYLSSNDSLEVSDDDEYRRLSYHERSIPVNVPSNPLQLQHAAELQTRLAPLNHDISAILIAYGLPEDTLFLPYHASKADYPGGDQPINLLYRCTSASERKIKCHPAWSQSKTISLVCCWRKELAIFMSRFANLDLCFSPSLFPLHPQTPIVLGFDRVKYHLIDILQEMLSTNWRLLCPFNVGSTEKKKKKKKKARPTLIVMVEPHTPGDWYNLSISLKTTMRKAMGDERDQDFEVGPIRSYPGICHTFLVAYLTKIESRSERHQQWDGLSEFEGTRGPGPSEDTPRSVKAAKSLRAC